MDEQELHYKMVKDFENRLDSRISRTEDRMYSKLTDINRDLTRLHTDIVMLKVKSGIWGLIAGSIPPIIMFIVFFIKNNWKI